MSLICKLKGLFRTLKYALKTMDFETSVDGCMYEDIEEIENCTVIITRCLWCGREEVERRQE